MISRSNQSPLQAAFAYYKQSGSSAAEDILPLGWNRAAIYLYEARAHSGFLNTSGSIVVS